nr:PREDICTED: UPF0544 protein C5orf45 homolog [Apteryx mantelli mantelli]
MGGPKRWGALCDGGKPFVVAMRSPVWWRWETLCAGEPCAVVALGDPVYGEGSGLDCRLHVQKLNLLQGEAEEALSWTSRCIEESVDDNKNIAIQCEDSLVEQEAKAEVSRWNKYLDQGNETQEDEEEEESGGTERQQFCSRRKNTVEEQRKHQNSFPYTDVQELSEENGAFQFAYQAKKRKQCSVAVPNQGDGDAVCGDSMSPALCESVVSEGNTQTPAPSIKSSKWEKFLSCSDCSENAAKVTLSPQEGGRKLGLHSSTAADIFMVSRYSKKAGNFLPPGAGIEFKKCLASTEQLAPKLPSTVLPVHCSADEDMLFKEPQGHFIRAGSAVLDTTAGRCPVARSVMPVCPPAATLALSDPGLKPSSISHEPLFCTGDEFDDDL